MLIRYSSRAVRDIGSIRRWSTREWGFAKTEQYLRSIKSEIARIAGSTLYAAVARPWKYGLSRFRCTKHYLFFRFDSNVMFISRIVHTSMDLDRIVFPVA